MAGLNPRRLTGRALQLSAKAAGIPGLAGGARALGRPLLGLAVLRDARLGAATPDLAPPLPSSPTSEGSGGGPAAGGRP